MSVLFGFLCDISVLIVSCGQLYSKEEKPEEPELPKYRDRAKERREDQNPDYEITELTSFHAVAPPGAVDVL